MKFAYDISSLGVDTWRIDEVLGTAHTYAYLLAGSERAMLIDTCQGLGDLRTAAENLTDKPIFVALTHGHLDHIGGSAAFEEVYLAPEDLPVAQEHGDPAYRQDVFARFSRELDVPMEEGLMSLLAHRCEGARYRPLAAGREFELGGRRLRTLPVPGHTPGSVCFYEEERGALYTGDTVCARGVLLSLPHSCSVETFHRSIRRLQALAGGAWTLHPGHHEAPLAPEVLEDYERCARRILEGTLRGAPGEAAGEACMLAPWGQVSLAYRPNHILD